MLPIRTICIRRTSRIVARRVRMLARSFARDFGARLVVMHVVEATHVAEELGDAFTRSPDSPYLGANTVEK